MIRKTILTVLAIEASVMAHTGAGMASGLMEGFFHPITGVDHVLAMVGIGIWAVVSGGRSLWAVPLSFVIMMVFGAFLGMQGAIIPFIEEGIMASVVVIGGLIAFKIRLGAAAGSALAALFAFFHGAAHGAEMPGSIGGVEYGTGFVAATLILHAIGIALALANASRTRKALHV